MLKDKDNLAKLIIFGVIILFMLVYLIINRDEAVTLPEIYKVSDDYSLEVALNNIDNNYNMNITNGINSFGFSTDSKIKLYNIEDNNGYIEYNNKIYFVDENYKISSSMLPEYIIKEYTDINYIKETLKACDIKVEDNKAICEIENDIIEVYYTEKINKITIGDYIITISNIGLNNYDEIINYYNESFN